MAWCRHSNTPSRNSDVGCSSWTSRLHPSTFGRLNIKCCWTGHFLSIVRRLGQTTFCVWCRLSSGPMTDPCRHVYCWARSDCTRGRFLAAGFGGPQKRLQNSPFGFLGQLTHPTWPKSAIQELLFTSVRQSLKSATPVHGFEILSSRILAEGFLAILKTMSPTAGVAT